MKSLAILTPVLFLAACTDYHTSGTGAMISHDVHSKSNASIVVGDKVSGSAECNDYLFFIKSRPERQTYIPEMMSKVGNLADEQCTAGAVYDAVSKNNIDLLIAPQYTSVKTGFLCTPIGCLYSNTKIIVSGYSAKINSIK